jgi:hypothetical protein
MSEKSLIIFGVLGIILTATFLMYQMIDKDLQKQKRTFVNENQNAQIITTQKIEIETRK